MTLGGNEKILLIDKPSGITSFDVIRKLRRQTGIKKMGHAGTLDPLASGLMIIGLEKGTKKLAEFLKLDKSYIAEITLGISTDTGDITGNVVDEKKIPALSSDVIESEISKMIGEINLPVPVYSAIKKNGKPLYLYARQGQKVSVPIRKMIVLDAKLIKIKGNTITVNFYVTSGTYIRSIVEELGRRLGTVATLSALRRISIGQFRVEDAQELSS